MVNARRKVFRGRIYRIAAKSDGFDFNNLFFLCFSLSLGSKFVKLVYEFTRVRSHPVRPNTKNDCSRNKEKQSKQRETKQTKQTKLNKRN